MTLNTCSASALHFPVASTVAMSMLIATCPHQTFDGRKWRTFRGVESMPPCTPILHLEEEGHNQTTKFFDGLSPAAWATWHAATGGRGGMANQHCCLHCCAGICRKGQPFYEYPVNSMRQWILETATLLRVDCWLC